MTSAEVRAGINAKQAALAKMGGSKRLSKRHKRSGKRRTNKHSDKRRTYKRHYRKSHHKIRGGAVAPTTTGGSQQGSTKLFMAQQQAGANRQFDTPNKT